MATDMNRLQGEVAENPAVPSFQNDSEDIAVQKLLMGFLRSLLHEQGPEVTRQPELKESV